MKKLTSKNEFFYKLFLVLYVWEIYKFSYKFYVCEIYLFVFIIKTQILSSCH